MDMSKNGIKHSLKDMLSKKISGYRKVSAEDVGQSIQILLTNSEESDGSECESVKEEFCKIKPQHIPRIFIRDEVSFPPRIL